MCLKMNQIKFEELECLFAQFRSWTAGGDKAHVCQFVLPDFKKFPRVINNIKINTQYDWLELDEGNKCGAVCVFRLP